MFVDQRGRAANGENGKDGKCYANNATTANGILEITLTRTVQIESVIQREEHSCNDSVNFGFGHLGFSETYIMSEKRG